MNRPWKLRRWILTAALVAVGACENSVSVEPELPTIVTPSQRPSRDVSNLPSETPREIVAGPFLFTRSTGQPKSVSYSVEVADRWAYSGDLLILVEDVSTSGQVSSARVSVGGQEILASNSFPLEAGSDSSRLTLDGSFEVEALVRGKPQTALRITILGDFLPGHARIGPEGGQVLADDGLGRLYVPATALDKPTILRVEREEFPDSINFSTMGQALYHLQPEGLVFNTPARFERDIGGDAQGTYVGWYYIPERAEVLYTEGTEARALGTVSTSLPHFSWVLILSKIEFPKTEIEWSVRKHPTYGDAAITDAEFEEDLQAALAQWENFTADAGLSFFRSPSPGFLGLTFEAVDPTENASLRHYFEFAPDRFASGVSGFNLLRGQFVVLLNEQVAWMTARRQPDPNDEEQFQVLGVALHEIGHNFGINTHLNGDVIMKSGGGFTSTPSLRCGDLEALQAWSGAALTDRCGAVIVRQGTEPFSFSPGEPVGPGPRVTVQDINGDPVAGVPVLIEGLAGEVVTPRWTITDSIGEVQITDWIPALGQVESTIRISSSMLANPSLTLTASATTRPFLTTSLTYPHTTDMNQVCRDTFGPQFRNTDWRDVKEALAEGLSIEEIQPSNRPHAWTTHFGQEYWSGSRRYFASIPPVHTGYLIHHTLDEDGGSTKAPVVVMGSWYGTYHVNCTTWTSPNAPPALVYEDDFESGLANWTEVDPDGLGSWSTPGGELIGDYQIGCGSSGCHQLQLLLAEQFQPGSGDWRIEVQSGLVEAYCCYNGGATVNLAKFVLWVSNSEKEQMDVGWGWQGLQAPSQMTQVRSSHQSYPWTQLGTVTIDTDPWVPAQWQTAALEKRGNEYSIYFNGVLVKQVTRTFSSPPKVGLTTYGRVRMDNFKLYALP